MLSGNLMIDLNACYELNSDYLQAPIISLLIFKVILNCAYAFVLSIEVLHFFQKLNLDRDKSHLHHALFYYCRLENFGFILR